MVTILDGMNRLENLTRLVGRGTGGFAVAWGLLVIPFRYRDKCISTGGCSLFSVYF
jgi:hypothetical protein